MLVNLSVSVILHYVCMIFFFFNDTATTEIYTLSLHDALPISGHSLCECAIYQVTRGSLSTPRDRPDRKSTRLNSSHSQISYAVFCLKKKKTRSSVFPIASTLSIRRRVIIIGGCSRDSATSRDV